MVRFLKDETSRYAMYGVTSQKHQGEIVTTSVGDDKWDTLVRTLPNKFNYRIGRIPVGYEHRPDRISDLFYNTPGYWWLLMVVNGVADPFNGFNAGDRIKIPEL